MKKIIVNILRGMIIWAANVIPWVSWGTMAFITGIYDKLINALPNFLSNKSKRKSIALFLWSIAIWWILGVLGFAKVVSWALSQYELVTKMFFSGLILWSLPIIYNSLWTSKIEYKYVMAFLLGIGLLVPFMIVSVDQSGQASMQFSQYSSIMWIAKWSWISWMYSLKLLGCGILAAISMIVPWVSGSFLLLLLGEYQNIIYFVDQRYILPIMVVGLGAMVGGLGFVHFFSQLFDKYYNIIMYFIGGLVVWSLWVILKWYSFSQIFTSLYGLIGFWLGWVSAWWMTYLSPKE